MGQGGGAVKVVKRSRRVKSTFWTHFRRVSGRAADIAKLRRLPAASGIAKPPPADYKAAPSSPFKKT